MIWVKMIIAGIITFLTRFLLVSLIKKKFKWSIIY